MKIKEEQLKQIQQIQNELKETLTSIGYLESQKHAFLHEIKSINERDAKMKEDIEKEYGAININVDDGTYTFIEDKVEENA
jgi:uncharacterized protein YoxC